MEADCLVNIFRRLGLDDLSLGVPFVCRSWYRASLDPLCWKVLDFQGLNFMPWSEFSKRFVKRYSPPQFSFSSFMRFVVGRSSGSVVEVRFPLLFGASLEDFVFASKECPSLKVLALPKLMSEDEVHIPQLVGKWKDLRRLEMESKPSSFCKMATQIGLNCKKFGKLKMHGAIKEEDVSAIVKSLPKLKCLDLNKSYLPMEQLFAIMNGCKELDRLSVRDCIGFEADDKVLRRASRIKTFEHEGSKLREDFMYDTDDECDYLYVQVI